MTAQIYSSAVLRGSTVQIKHHQAPSRRLVVPPDPERGRYLVKSASGSGRFYEVALQRGELAGHCTCPWPQYDGMNCKHVLAALRAHYAPEGTLSFWPSDETARRQHRRMLLGERL